MNAQATPMPAPARPSGGQPARQAAPPWTIGQWFNSGAAPQLADLRGKVVVLHAFQMLCPACVQHGVPQAQRVHTHFAARDVAVIGLHCVFEHHAAMTPISLQVFLHEFRVTFPVAVDAPGADLNDPIPATMQAYGMQGTPSLVLIDRNGLLRHHWFGATDDLALGAAIATLIAERV